MATAQARGRHGDLIAATSDIALVLLAKGEDSRACFWSDRGLTRAAQIPKPARAFAYAHQRRAELEHLRGNLAAAHIYACEAIQTYEALGMIIRPYSDSIFTRVAADWSMAYYQW